MIRIEQDDERTRRLAEVWQESAPGIEEMLALRARLTLRSSRPRRTRGKVLIIALIQGFMLGGATLAAAAWVAGRAMPLFEHREQEAPANGPGALPAPARTFALPAEPDPQPASPTEEVPSAAFGDVPAGSETETAKLGHPEETSRHRTPVRVRSATAPAKAEAVTDVSPPASEAPVPPEAAATPADGPWARVARALTASDFTRADRALAELCSTPDPATRDAATLARAELWIAHGQGRSLRPTVERLAESGFTPLVRRRAARLLERLP